jgi:hypothetical protein
MAGLGKIQRDPLDQHVEIRLRLAQRIPFGRRKLRTASRSRRSASSNHVPRGAPSGAPGACEHRRRRRTWSGRFVPDGGSRTAAASFEQPARTEPPQGRFRQEVPGPGRSAWSSTPGRPPGQAAVGRGAHRPQRLVRGLGWPSANPHEPLPSCRALAARIDCSPSLLSSPSTATSPAREVRQQAGPRIDRAVGVRPAGGEGRIEVRPSAHSTAAPPRIRRRQRLQGGPRGWLTIHLPGRDYVARCALDESDQPAAARRRASSRANPWDFPASLTGGGRPTRTLPGGRAVELRDAHLVRHSACSSGGADRGRQSRGRGRRGILQRPAVAVLDRRGGRPANRARPVVADGQPGGRRGRSRRSQTSGTSVGIPG